MEHGKQYSITLSNNQNKRCDAEITIDGKVVGTWRLEAWQTAVLERGVEDKGRFTCYHTNTKEGTKAQLNNVSKKDLGLVQVKFTPEIPPPPVNTWKKYRSGPCGQSVSDGLELSACCNYSSAGTGLSGKSNQEFGTAGTIVHDTANQVIISLRLVGEQNGPRPLVAVGKGNPVPRPV